MAKYEVMYIIRANVDEEVMKKVNADMADAFTSTGSTVLECNEWGLRDLAYEIEGCKKGYYVLLTVEANGASINEFTRRANISENVIRYITVAQN